jgi:CelD/BcsL family acetyltransferase involved in cellulose biosynthesis
MREEWDYWVTDLGAPVYMSYDWLRLWWQFYGKGARLSVFKFSIGGVLVGVVPLYISVLGIPPFQIRVARLVGANVPPKVFNPPVPSLLSVEIWQHTLQHMFANEKCDLVSIGPLSESYVGLDGLKETANKGNSNWGNGRLTDRDVHTVYYLPKTAEELFSAIDRKELKVRRKKLRELESKGPVRVDIVKDSVGVNRELESFAQQHKTQWEAERRPGHFSAWPQSLDLHRELVSCQGKLGRVRFVRLMLGDQVIANQYNYAFGRSLFAELPARVVGAEWDRLSLGCSSQLKLLEAAVVEGFEIMESGLGHYDYKVLLGGCEHKAITLRYHAKQATSRAKVRGCSILRDSISLLSQKLWYRRISPLLPKRLRLGQSEMALTYDF